MRIIYLPFGVNTFAVLGIIKSMTKLMTFIIAVIALCYGMWETFFINFSILLPLLIYDLLVFRGKIFLVARDKYSMQFIKKIDKDGFTNYHYDDGVEVRYDWESIKHCELDNDKNLLITLTSGVKQFIKIDNENDFELLSKIPSSKLLDNQIPNYVNQVCSEVRSCKVCGKIAVWNEECLSCGSEVYNPEKHNEFDNEINYIKQEQLECFETFDKEQKVDFLEDNIKFFKQNLDWKPLVTEAEVIGYSKEWNWD